MRSVMKKLMFFGLSILLLSFVFISDTYGQGQGGKRNFQGRGANCQFVDLNNDGICDNFVDANNDGICDNCPGCGKGGWRGKGNNFQGQGLHLRQRNFVDNNGDGICDNYQSRAIISRPSPNPFTSTTNFSLSLPSAGNVSITVNDLEGKVVKNVFSGKLEKGDHNFTIDSQNLTPGRYLIVVKFNNRTFSRHIFYRP